MQRRMWIRAAICLTATFAVVLTALFFGASSDWGVAALASEESASAVASHSVTVVGEGVVKIEPDVASARVGVVVLRPTVREASSEANEIMEGIKAALFAQEIGEKDIQTRQYSIHTERYGPEGLLDEDQAQYRVSHSVIVTIRDLGRIGDILDAAIEAGANDIGNIRFSLENPAAVESRARAMAVADGRAKVEALAELVGAGVGEVSEISEIIGYGGGFYGSSFSDMALAESAGAFGIGALTLAMQLQITYELR